ncbi:Thioredoxin family protein [Trichomonas vaginalis G3]|uniref:Thioredoxin family protein n=1 Tax=Trichomonas vaginalis (strain ATCC PRA-98 / G3) TaxID=412133 RepID=A2E2R0_TRIV3|nr:cell redox homeostasis [Trichomonas vaginalis G3]EAY13088.1 Thioredoxin family protein [Trichomonas vaginalis G3]KAI5548277.1 cell redox homeostasis [Trichomonas vaginalis G3]|eukprot:XP_001325311.1 Thioredoxin family protein [Trichomonas vaginalis G3]
MISILFQTTFSLSHKLTSENYTSIVHNEGHIPVFLKAWASWCPHCKELAPIWDELSNNTAFENRVIFADIECESNRKLCQTLSGENFPRLYWIDQNTDNSLFKYEGPRNLADLVSFVTKQLNFPLLPANENELDDIVAKANRSTTFVFTIDPNDDVSIGVAKQSVLPERNSSSSFIIMDGPSGSKPRLTCYSGSKNVTFDYKGQWLADRINHFIALKTIRFLRYFDGYVLRYSNNRAIRVFTVVTNSSQDEIPDSAREQAVQASNMFIVAREDCYGGSWFCRYTDIHPVPGKPTFVIYSGFEKLFWTYNESEIFYDWLVDVNSDKIKGNGPGTGWLNLIKKPFYDAKIDGRAPPYLVFVVPIVFVILIVIIFCDITGLNDAAKTKTE